MSRALSPWASAAQLLARWLGSGGRIDELMESLPSGMGPTERARCQYLVYGVIRHSGRIDSVLGRLIAHSPRFITRAVLLLAGFELIEGGDPPLVIHHAVEQAKGLASPAEARLANAVARKLAHALAGQTPPGPIAPASDVAEYFSHPVWLVRRWLALYGAEATRALVEWNQKPAPVYARWRGRASEPRSYERGYVPEGGYLKPTAWPGFFEVEGGHWEEVEALLKDRAIYIQDPSTRLAVDLLAPQRGENVLDLCAAPGGKALAIADRMGEGRVVAVDLPGSRLDRLRQNLAGAAGVSVAVLGADFRRGLPVLLRRESLAETYAAVLLDAPCTNTGVMRHRIDVKWRLQEGDFRQHARQQLDLLQAAAALVAPGGRLVYSTCSIDPEENEKVVESFLQRSRGEFALEEKAVFYPWTEGHDGGAAFRLRRVPDWGGRRPPGDG